MSTDQVWDFYLFVFVCVCDLGAVRGGGENVMVGAGGRRSVCPVGFAIYSCVCLCAMLRWRQRTTMMVFGPESVTVDDW